jgi:phosphonate transport system substrate-binding protein
MIGRWLVALLLGLGLVSPAPASAEPAERPIRFLVPPLSQPNQVYSRFQPLARYLAAQTDAMVRLRVAGDLESYFRLAAEERPQLIYLCPLSYVHLADYQPLHPLARIKRGGKATFRSAILVRADSRFQNLSELQGARFAYGNVACATSKLVPEAMLRRAGVDPRRDLFERRAMGSNENALYTVAANLFDATAVDEHTARPFLNKGLLRAVAYSRPIPQYLVAATDSVAPAQRRRMARALTELQRPADRAVLEALGSETDGFLPTGDSDYDVLREMRRQRADSGQAPLPLPEPPANGSQP